MKNRKKLLLTSMAILFFLALIMSATYAYLSFSVNNFGTKSIKTNLAEIESVALTTGNELNMTLTIDQMNDKGEDIIYYASSNGTTTTETTEVIGKTIVTGNKTYNCNYTITIDDNENSLYDVFQQATVTDLSQKSVTKTNQIILTVNDQDYDFGTASLFPKAITGTLDGLTKYDSKEITAKLMFINKTGISQTALANSTLKLTFTIDEFSCDVAE